MPLVFTDPSLHLRLRSKKVAALLTTNVDAKKLAISKAKASALISTSRTKLVAGKPQSFTLLQDRISKIKRTRGASVKRAIDTRAMRTPDQIIAAFVLRVKVSRSAAKSLATPARLIVRSTQANLAAFVKGLSGCLGVDVASIGVVVKRLPLTPGPVTSYSVMFPIDHTSVRTELLNLAWAMRKKGVFHSVAVSGLRGNFFAPTAATRAERNFDWHLDLTRASRAHAIPPKRGGRALGEGIVIAHIDSGWAEHSQYNSAQIDIARSHNVVTGATGSENAKHSIRNRDADAPQITHGTATGSVILGGRIDDGQELISTASDAALAFGTESDGKRKYNDKRVLDTNGHLTGVAPKATMLPIKFISDSALLEITDRGVHGAGVFRLFDEDLINAIQYAIDAKAHVISLSVGGLLHDEVREIINTAVEKHNIIIAAAVGQTYLNNAVSAIADGLNVVGVGGGDSVVLPAAYSNVIAVAGCSPSGEPWSETHRGPNVDITAPADAIWIADYKSKDSRSGNATRGETLECASGTSFAAPHVAGAAALWLAHHGRQTLIGQYGPAGIPLAWVFRQQIQKTARAIGTWDDGLYGPGIINVEALLNEPLPRPEDVVPPPAMVNGIVPGVSGGLEAAGEAFQDAFLEFMDWAGAQADNSERQAAIIWLAGQQAADRTIKDLGNAWAQLDAAAQGAAADVKAEIDRTKRDIERGINDVVKQTEDAIEEAGDQIEDVIDEAGKAVEEFSDNVGEAASDVGNAVAGFFGW